MTLQDFKGLLEAQPFEAFRIVMSSGESYEVRHPEMAKLMRMKLIVYLHLDLRVDCSKAGDAILDGRLNPTS